MYILGDCNIIIWGLGIFTIHVDMNYIDPLYFFIFVAKGSISIDQQSKNHFLWSHIYNIN